MKKFLTLTLLPVFLFSIIGWQWSFMLSLNSHREMEWKKSGEITSLQIIRVSKKSSKETFFVNVHELIHAGKRYDVKYKKEVGNEILYYCERDSNEEDLINSFGVNTQNSFDPEAASKTKTPGLLKLPVFEKLNIVLCPRSPIDSYKFTVIRSTDLVSSSIVDAFFVPPEAA